MYHFSVFWPFNFTSVKEKHNLKVGPTEKTEVKRLKDRQRIKKYTIFVAKKLKMNDNALIDITEDDYNTVYNDMYKSANKTSADER